MFLISFFTAMFLLNYFLIIYGIVLIHIKITGLFE